MGRQTIQYKCTVPRALPAIYDSRFDPAVTDKAFGGKVKRKHRYVKRGDILGFVGFESRGQFEAMNDDTEAKNEDDRQMLLGLLRDLNVDVKGDEPLHQLGKTYNYYDPRLAHVRRKSHRVSERTAIIGMKSDKAPDKPNDSAEIAELRQWLDDNEGTYHHANGVVKLREAKGVRLAEIEAAKEQ